MSNSLAHLRHSESWDLKVLESQKPSERADTITPPSSVSDGADNEEIKGLPTAVGMAFIGRSARLLATVKRNEVRIVERRGADDQAGKGSKAREVHDEHKAAIELMK